MNNIIKKIRSIPALIKELYYILQDCRVLAEELLAELETLKHKINGKEKENSQETKTPKGT